MTLPAAWTDGNDVAKLYATLGLNSIVFDDACKADLQSSRRAMLRYYTSCFAFMLTTNLENNYFLSGERAAGSLPPRSLHAPLDAPCYISMWESHLMVSFSG